MIENLTRILLVEDDEAHAELVCRAFEAHRDRYRLSVASSLEEARTYLSKDVPDLIITDLRLPDGEGTDLLLGDEEDLTVPLMVMTAQGNQTAAVEAMKAGAMEYLVKSDAVLADTPHIADSVLREWRNISEKHAAEEAARRWAEETLVMSEIGRVISSSLNINELYDQLGEALSKLIPFDRIHLGLVDYENSTTSPVWQVGTDLPGRRVGDKIPLEGALAGEVVVTRAPIMLEPKSAADLEHRYPLLMASYNAGLRSFIAVPLIDHDIVIGVLQIRSRAKLIYTQRHLDLAERIANQIAGAVANSALYAEHKRLAEENSVMAEIGQTISSSLDINEVYQELSDHIKKLIPFDRLSLSLVNKETQTTSRNWLVGTLTPGREAGDEVPLAGALAGEVVQTRSPLMLEVGTAAEVKRRFPLLMPAYNVGLRSFLSVPLINRDVVIGVLQIRARAKGIYTQRHLDLAERIANQITGAIANSQLYAERARLADENLKMAEIARVTNSSLDISDVYDRLGEAVRQLIPLDRMTLSRFEQESETISQIWGFGTEVPPRPPEIPQSGSFAEVVIRSKQPALLCEDYEPDLIARFPALALNFQAGLRSFMAAPLIYRDEVIGVLQIRSKELGAYTQFHLELAARVAKEISGAVANSQLYTDRKRLAEENSVMAEIGRIISSTLDINEVHGRLGEQARVLIPFDHMSLSLIDQENGVSSVTWVFGQDIPGQGPGDIVPLDGAFVNKVVLAGSPVMLEVEAEADLLGEAPRQLPAFRSGMRSFVGVPLFYRDDLIGVLQLQSKEQGIYSQRNLDLAERVGNQIAGAVANSQLFAERTRFSEENSVMAEIGRIIGSSLDINDVFDTFTHQVRRLISFNQLDITIIHPNRKRDEVAFSIVQSNTGSWLGESTPLEDSLTGRMAIDRAGLVIQEMKSDEVELEYPCLGSMARTGFRSWLAVPLISRDESIGALFLASTKETAFTQADLELADRIGNQIAGAVANSQLYSERARLSEENQVIADIGRIISSSLGITYVFDQVSDEIRKIIPFDASSVSLIDHTRELAIPTWVSGTYVPGRTAGDEIPLAGAFAGEAVRTRLPILLEAGTKADLDNKFPHLTPAYNAGLRSFIAVPLMASGIVTGVFQLRSKEQDIYTPAQLELAERIGNQIAGAITNFQLVTERTRSGHENLVMAEIGRIIDSSLDIDEVYSAVTEEARKIINFDRMSVSFIDFDQNQSIQTYISGVEISGRLAGDRIALIGAFGGEAALTRSSMMFDAASEEEVLDRFPLLAPAFRSGLRSFLAVPMVNRDNVIGVFQILSTEFRAYSANDLVIAERIALQISGAIANAQLYADRKRLAEENSVIAEIGRIISSSLDINQVYGQLCEEVRKVIPFDRLDMSIVDFAKQTTLPTWALGPAVPGRHPGVEIPLDGSLAGEVVRTRVPFILEAETEADIASQFPKLMPAYSIGLRSFLTAPLIDRDMVIAVLHLRSKELGTYCQRHLDLAKRISNQISGAVASSRLFSERAQAQEAMRVSEQKYRTLVNESPDMIFVSRINDFQFTEVNDRACENYGYSREDLLAMNIFDLEVEPPLEYEVRSLYDDTPVGHVVEVYGTNKRRDGTTFPVHVRFAKLDDDFAIANVRDITQQKEAEELRKQWADESSALAEIGRVIASSLDVTEVYGQLGEEVGKLIPFDRFSMSLEQKENEPSSLTWWLGTTMTSGVFETSIASSKGLGGEAFRTKSPILIQVETETDFVDRFPQLMVAYQNDLRCFIAVPLIDRDSVIGVLRLASKNPRAYTQYHLDLAMRIGNQIAGALAGSQLYMERTKAEQDLQYANDNLERMVDERTAELTDSNQNLRREISERAHAEQELRESEGRFRQISENMRQVIFLINHQDYNVLYANQAFEEIWGRSCEALYENPTLWFDAIHPDDRAILKEAFDNQRTSGEFEAEFRIIRPDGTTRWIFDRTFPILNESQEIYRLLGIAEDITERKQAEERMQETARLASVGELAAGVAHEINNPLTSVLGFSDLVLKNDLPQQVSADMQTIHREAQRAAKIVQNLLFFARKRTAKKQYLDLNSVLTRSIEMKSYDFTVNNIEVVSQLSPDIRKTMVDEHQLVQVFLNILTNAEQAMKDQSGKGRIVVSTAMSGDDIEIIMKDDGPGIPDEVLHNIFEPFFTTKDIGQGTGLGLSISYGIINQHGGSIWVESTEGEGATFKITLPEVTPEETEDSDLTAPASLANITKHILVVDDEPDIRDLLKRYLEMERYTVDLAQNGQEAWRKIQNVHYDCAILDLKMPGMDGIELYHLIQDIGESMANRVVFITGDTVSFRTRDFIAETGNPVVTKPFTLEDLLLSIHIVDD